MDNFISFLVSQSLIILQQDNRVDYNRKRVKVNSYLTLTHSLQPSSLLTSVFLKLRRNTVAFTIVTVFPQCKKNQSGCNIDLTGYEQQPKPHIS